MRWPDAADWGAMWSELCAMWKVIRRAFTKINNE